MAAELQRGVLKSFDSGTYLASVQLAGSLSVWLAGISVSRGLPAAEMVAGRSVAVAFFDPANPTDAVVVAVYI